MRKGIVLCICVLQIFNAGCASIIHGGKQTVRIETNPPGAAVRVGHGHMEMVSPANLVLKRKHEYEIKVEKPGYRTEYIEVDNNLGGWFWGNLLSWGIIGIIVDLCNGAAYNLEPKEVRISLQPGEGEAKR